MFYFSPDGDMLCSQGGDPDFLITIWNWETSQIILRTKSHGQDVINVAFSLYCPGQLVSSGNRERPFLFYKFRVEMYQ